MSVSVHTYNFRINSSDPNWSFGDFYDAAISKAEDFFNDNDNITISINCHESTMSDTSFSWAWADIIATYIYDDEDLKESYEENTASLTGGRQIYPDITDSSFFILK